MSKALNIIVRTSIVFAIIGATLNVVGELLLVRGGQFPATSALLSWGLRGALIGVAVGVAIGALIALLVGAFRKYTSPNRRA